MKIGIISHRETPTLAVFFGDCWVSVPQALKDLGKPVVNEMSDFINAYGDEVIALNRQIGELVNTGKAKDYTFPVAGASFLPPVPASPTLLTARGNSACFTRVSRGAICKQPVMEQRYNFNLIGHNSTWTIKDGFTGDGWNYEMIVVMGKDCHNVSEKDANDYVFGYVNMLDHGGGYTDFPYNKGNKWDFPDEEKIFDDWAYQGCFNGNTQVPLPIGPYIVTKDEVGDPHDQMLEERENGRLVSFGSCNAVVFTFAEMISYMSHFLVLHPGDMMSSASITYDGYPGWAEKRPENAYYQATTDKLGTLRMNIRDDRKEI